MKDRQLYLKDIFVATVAVQEVIRVRTGEAAIIGMPH